MCTTPGVTVFAAGTKFKLFPFEDLSALLFCVVTCGKPFVFSSVGLFLHENKTPIIIDVQVKVVNRLTTVFFIKYVYLTNRQSGIPSGIFTA